MKSKKIKKALSTSVASLTVFSTLNGSISTKIYATTPGVQKSTNDNNTQMYFSGFAQIQEGYNYTLVCSYKGYNFAISCSKLDHKIANQYERIFKNVMKDRPYDESIPAENLLMCYIDNDANTMKWIENLFSSQSPAEQKARIELSFDCTLKNLEIENSKRSKPKIENSNQDQIEFTFGDMINYMNYYETVSKDVKKLNDYVPNFFNLLKINKDPDKWYYAMSDFSAVLGRTMFGKDSHWISLKDLSYLGTKHMVIGNEINNVRKSLESDFSVLINVAKIESKKFMANCMGITDISKETPFKKLFAKAVRMRNTINSLMEDFEKINTTTEIKDLKERIINCKEIRSEMEDPMVREMVTKTLELLKTKEELKEAEFNQFKVYSSYMSKMSESDSHSEENFEEEFEEAETTKEEKRKEFTDALYRFSLEVQELPRKILIEKLEKMDKGKTQKNPKYRRNSFGEKINYPEVKSQTQQYNYSNTTQKSTTDLTDEVTTDSETREESSEQENQENRLPTFRYLSDLIQNGRSQEEFESKMIKVFDLIDTPENRFLWYRALEEFEICFATLTENLTQTEKAELCKKFFDLPITDVLSKIKDMLFYNLPQEKYLKVVGKFLGIITEDTSEQETSESTQEDSKEDEFEKDITEETSQQETSESAQADSKENKLEKDITEETLKQETSESVQAKTQKSEAVTEKLQEKEIEPEKKESQTKKVKKKSFWSTILDFLEKLPLIGRLIHFLRK